MTRAFFLPPKQPPKPYDGPSARTLRGKELAARKAELEARDGRVASEIAIRQARHRERFKRGAQ